MGESDHQTSNGEYDEDTSGFEDDRLSQSNDQAGDGQLQDNLNSDGNFIDDQENSGTSGDHQSDGGSDIQATELESGNYELDFSMEEELLYTRRFDEGYDVFDEKYVQWLKVHHPEKVASKNVVQLSANCLSSDTSQPTINQLESCPAASETTLHSGLPDVNSTLPLPSNHNTPTSTGTDSVAIASNPINSPSTPKSRLCLSAKRTPLSNLFNLHSSMPHPKTGKARVLTSNQCLALLKEKEEKKRRVALEKENRRQERLTKKIDREEQQKKKQEEKARKALEKAQKVTQKAHSQASARLRKQVMSTTNLFDSPGPSTSVDNNAEITDASSQMPRTRSNRNERETIVSMKPSFRILCCVCFGCYSDDRDTSREWLQCKCGRWLHEDCIDEPDDDKLCPLC